MGHITTATRTPAAPFTTVGADVEGERFDGPTRMVIAPAAGVFEPAFNLAAGAAITAGQVVGHLTSGTTRTPVVSPFAGRSGDTIAWAGERLSSHQPVMWLSTDSGRP